MIRRSRKITFSFLSYSSISNRFRQILENIQQHVVEQFGYRHVNALRTANARFPDDPIIREAFYSA